LSAASRIGPIFSIAVSGGCDNLSVLRLGSGEPLVLLHGVMGSERMWQDVAPLLAADNDVIALTALGHAGGPPPLERPAGYRDVLDTAERQLDELSLDRAHLVGNSMGGWIALDLARRGRALSVYAISPAGMWPPGGASGSRARLRQGLRMGRLARPVLPILYRSPRIRRFALRHIAADGASVPRDRALELTDDMLGCRIAEDMLSTEEWFAPLDPAPCPITIAWCQLDRVFPEREFGARAKERVPGARYVVLGNVGHVPMLEDPRLLAAVIRESLDATSPSP
jgi:pimeloyl-ACP methyl ester carboxylesterase